MKLDLALQVLKLKLQWSFKLGHKWQQFIRLKNKKF